MTVGVVQDLEVVHVHEAQRRDCGVLARQRGEPHGAAHEPGPVEDARQRVVFRLRHLLAEVADALFERRALVAQLGDHGSRFADRRLHAKRHFRAQSLHEFLEDDAPLVGVGELCERRRVTVGHARQQRGIGRPRRAVADRQQ